MAGDAFQKLKSSINRGVTTISLKTSSSLEKAKIKTHIESIDAELTRLIASAGEAAYGIWESGQSDYRPLEETFALIKQKKAEIEQLKSEYAVIDERDNQILGNTEESAQQPAEVKAEQGVFCANCGTRYPTPVNFCRKCGKNLNEQ